MADTELEPQPDRLPPFPVDEQTLDLLHHALHPGPDAQRTSVTDLCEIYGQLAGVPADGGGYHVNEVLAAVLADLRRVRDGSIAATVAEEVEQLCPTRGHTEHPAGVCEYARAAAYLRDTLPTRLRGEQR